MTHITCTLTYSINLATRAQKSTTFEIQITLLVKVEIIFDLDETFHLEQDSFDQLTY